MKKSRAWPVAVMTMGMTVATSMTPSGAHALGRPARPDPVMLPADAPPRPVTPAEQRALCARTSPIDDSNAIPSHLSTLNVAEAHQLSLGAGQLVAVIDTGVTRHRQLPRLIAGGDYVSTSDGTQDCDAHGTIVAGLIAAAPSNENRFVGVAPEATILTLRQSSATFSERRDGSGTGVGVGAGTVVTLAAAVRRAADSGATVINISEVACSTQHIDDQALGAALHYAATVRNVVVVAAAGNTDRCPTANPVPSAAQTEVDPWNQVATIVSPAWYDDDVLTVGSVDAHGNPSDFTVGGPWVDIAAPGEELVGLSSDGHTVAQAIADDRGQHPFNGTSFAAPIAAGVAALVRARFPELSARQVMDRITQTAHHGSTARDWLIGSGIVDPLAALSGDLHAPAPTLSAHRRLTHNALSAAAQTPSRTPAQIAAVATSLGLLLGAAGSWALHRGLRGGKGGHGVRNHRNPGPG